MPARFALRSRFDLRQLSTIGYGDITAGNEYERAFAIVCMIAGAAIFSSIVGTLLHVSQARLSSQCTSPSCELSSGATASCGLHRPAPCAPKPRPAGFASVMFDGRLGTQCLRPQEMDPDKARFNRSVSDLAAYMKARTIAAADSGCGHAKRRGWLCTRNPMRVEWDAAQFGYMARGSVSCVRCRLARSPCGSGSKCAGCSRSSKSACSSRWITLR